MRRLELSTSEILEMRKQGMSNKEIAKALDVSVPTIVRWIGAQGRRAKNREGVSKLPPKEKEAEVLVVTQNVMVNGYAFEISHVGGDGKHFSSRHNRVGDESRHGQHRRSHLRT